jgi:hypothetical protein
VVHYIGFSVPIVPWGVGESLEEAEASAEALEIDDQLDSDTAGSIIVNRGEIGQDA